MTNSERAQQLWPLLVLAARNQQVLGYAMIEQMTGIARQGLGQPLGSIYYYCKRQDLPLLNLLAISQKTGKPGFEVLKNMDLPTAQARVFLFDWLSHGIPSTQDFDEARSAEEVKAAKAAST